MHVERSDPLFAKAQADLIIEQAAEQLSRLLHEEVANLAPFPPFPGAYFTYAIEAEPDGAADPERGCIVVGSDGELYELKIGVDLDSLAFDGLDDPVSLRKEELQPLDLHPRDYIVYAYNALHAVIEKRLEQLEARAANPQADGEA